MTASAATTPKSTRKYGSCWYLPGAAWSAGLVPAAWLAGRRRASGPPPPAAVPAGASAGPCGLGNGLILRRVRHRAASGTQVRSASPMYSLSGLISRLSACCSITWAVHPAIRLTEKTGVNRSVGIPR